MSEASGSAFKGSYDTPNPPNQSRGKAEKKVYEVEYERTTTTETDQKERNENQTISKQHGSWLDGVGYVGTSAGTSCSPLFFSVFVFLSFLSACHLFFWTTAQEEARGRRGRLRAKRGHGKTEWIWSWSSFWVSWVLLGPLGVVLGVDVKNGCGCREMQG